MGRPSKLTDRQWGEIGRRLTNGEGVNDLAREYKVDKAAISRRFSQQTEKLRNLANTLVTAERELESLPVSQQSCVISLMDQLRGIQTDYARGAATGARTAAKLQDLAEKKTSEIKPDKLSLAEVGESLLVVAELTKNANRAAGMASNLIAANKSRQEERDDEDLSSLSDEELGRRLREAQKSLGCK